MVKRFVERNMEERMVGEDSEEKIQC